MLFIYYINYYNVYLLINYSNLYKYLKFFNFKHITLKLVHVITIFLLITLL